MSRANALDPFSLWRELGLPSLCILEWPELVLREVVRDTAGG